MSHYLILGIFALTGLLALLAALCNWDWDLHGQCSGLLLDRAVLCME